MRIGDIVDRDDAVLLASGAVYIVLAAVVLLVLAGALGLAWTVFRVAGGL